MPSFAGRRFCQQHTECKMSTQRQSNALQSTPHTLSQDRQNRMYLADSQCNERKRLQNTVQQRTMHTRRLVQRQSDRPFLLGSRCSRSNRCRCASPARSPCRELRGWNLRRLSQQHKLYMMIAQRQRTCQCHTLHRPWPRSHHGRKSRPHRGRRKCSLQRSECLQGIGKMRHRMESRDRSRHHGNQTGS